MMFTKLSGPLLVLQSVTGTASVIACSRTFHKGKEPAVRGHGVHGGAKAPGKDDENVRADAIHPFPQWRTAGSGP